MDHLFIDTSFFESENFMQGKVLQELIELGQNGEIQIIINKIVYEEVKSRIHKSLERAKILINQIKKKGRATWLNEAHSQLLKLNVQTELTENIKDFDEFLEYGKVIILDYSKVSIGEVFTNYFENKPPFSVREEKKHEFPDAFSILIVEEWLRENDLKGYLISRDKDLTNYDSHIFTIIEDPAKYLDNKLREIDERNKQRVLDNIDKCLKDNQPEILSYIKTLLVEKVEEDLNYIEYKGRNIEHVEHVKVKSLKIDDFSIVNYEWFEDSDEVESSIELTINFELEAALSYDNYEYAFWDSEDKKYYNVEYETEIVKELITNKLILELNFLIEEDEINLQDFTIEEIDTIELQDSF